MIVRVVNIAVLVSLPIYYRRYFSSVVLKWVLAILFFSYFLAILDTNTFVSKQRLPHNNAQNTTLRVSARTHAGLCVPCRET